MVQICLLPAITLFLLATAAFVGGELLPRLKAWSRGFLAAAVLLHTFYLVFWFYEIGAPFFLRASDLLLLLAWVLGVVLLVLSRSDRWQSLGSWVCPLILMILLAALHRGGEYAMVREIWPQFWVVPLHLAAATVSAGLFVMALVVGIWLFMQDRRLKRHQITPETLRMPAIGNLANVLSGLLSAGWVLLTIVMATGAVMVVMQGRPVWAAGRHWMWAVVAWALYAVVLHSRLLRHRRARRGILLSLFGFLAILLTFIEAHTS